MTRAVLLATVVLASAGCSGGGGGASCQAGASLACTCTSGHAGAQICGSDGRLGTCVCDGSGGASNSGGGSSGGGSSSSGGGGGGSGGGGGTSTSGGPMVLAFSATTTSLTEGQSLTFSAVVTHPDGIDALAGGTLTTPDGAHTYGPFGAGAQKGTFALTLSWAQIHQTLPIDFVGSDSRPFRAVFYDTAGDSTTAAVSVTLACTGGVPACNGACVLSNWPVPNACVLKETSTTTRSSCGAVCAAMGLRCAPICSFDGNSAYQQRFAGLAGYGTGDAAVWPLQTCDEVPSPTDVDDSGKTQSFVDSACCCH